MRAARARETHTHTQDARAHVLARHSAFPPPPVCTVEPEDLQKAVQLVIMPRATIFDQPPQDEDQPPPPPPPPPPPSSEQEEQEEEKEEEEQDQVCVRACAVVRGSPAQQQQQRQHTAIPHPLTPPHSPIAPPPPPLAPPLRRRSRRSSRPTRCRRSLCLRQRASSSTHPSSSLPSSSSARRAAPVRALAAAARTQANRLCCVGGAGWDAPPRASLPLERPPTPCCSPVNPLQPPQAAPRPSSSQRIAGATSSPCCPSVSGVRRGVRRGRSACCEGDAHSAAPTNPPRRLVPACLLMQPAR